MKVAALLSILALAAAWPADARAPPRGAPFSSPSVAVDAVLDDLVRATESYQRGDFEQARVAARRAVDAPDFAILPAEVRHGALYLLAAAAAQRGENREAHEALKRSTAFPQAEPAEWNMRLVVAAALNDRADSVHSLTVVARNYPAFLRDLEPVWIVRLVAAPDPAPDWPARRFELVDALDDADWAPTDRRVPADMWLRQTLRWLERGNTAEAMRLSRRLFGPYAAVSVRVDRRFNAVLAADPARWNVAAAAEALIAKDRELVAAEPNGLERRNELTGALLIAGRFQEALRLADESLALALPTDGSASRLTDAASVNWTMDYRARALLLLGRHEEALQQRRRARRRGRRTATSTSARPSTSPACSWISDAQPRSCRSSPNSPPAT